jgi:hypothetical protein
MEKLNKGLLYKILQNYAKSFFRLKNNDLSKKPKDYFRKVPRKTLL